MGEWAAFEQHYGPLLIQERIDVAGAMVSYVTASLAGVKNHSLSDYLPQWGGPDPVEPMPVDDMVAALKRIASKREGEQSGESLNARSHH